MADTLVSKVHDLVTKKYPNKNLNVSRNHILNVLKWSTARITRLEDLVTQKFGFLWILPASKEIEEQSKTLLIKLLEVLQTTERFDENSLKEVLRDFSSANEVKFPALMKMLRSVLSGLNEGPSVAEMLDVLGREQALERIRDVFR